MTDYKDTLNLPNTAFPMKANLPQREPVLLKLWQEKNLYQALRQKYQGAKKFILHDGPPYANGDIHIGHALNKISKDIIIKAKSLSGLDAPYVPGWDCHGLPIELNVEKKYGKVGEKLSAKEFRQKCREYASEQINIQRNAFQRLGVIGDWESPYLTMNFSYEADTIRALGKIIANGHLQQGFKPVHWCMDCQSALAEAEVEYADKTSPAIDVRFRIVCPEKFPGNGELSIPIWTTTPWTLPANEAVALNSQHTYALVQTAQERLLIVDELVESCLSRYGSTDYQVLEKYQQKDLQQLTLHHPFYEKSVPVIFGDHVTLDTGTGAVHTAPAHGQEDYIIGQQYELPVNNPVNEKGCFNADTPLFAGEFVFKANSHVIVVLREKNNLLCESKIEHSYPHCWRHKTPVIFRATPQWFISMEKNHLRSQACKAIQQTQWVPEWGQSRIAGMVEGRPDWCISRQRHWCVPMALIVNKHSKELHPDMPALVEKIAQRFEQQGLEAWYELNLKDLLGEEAEQYEKIADTLDVWFDSGVSHFAVLQKNSALQCPADIYFEGSDQHRGWFQSSLLTAVAMDGKSPFRAALTHGFTVDDKGRKMSKSMGNVIAPEKVMNTLGADVLRLWVAAIDYRNEVAVSDEILQRMADAYRRIRNTARFLLANLHDFDPIQNLLAMDKLLSLDHWIIAQAKQLQDRIKKAYDDYEFHIIYQELHNFCVVQLGSFYLDVIKDRQYTMQKNSRGRRSAQTAIHHVLQAMVRWVAPILSFTAEELWQYMPKQKDQETSIFLTNWYEFPQLDNEEVAWDKIIHLREEVNKAIETQRNAGVIGSALEARVVVKAPDEVIVELAKLKDELRFVFITSAAEILRSDKIKIEVAPITDAIKCSRCWHRRSDIGTNADHPELCGRCVDNLPEGKGEQRFYA